MRQPTEGARGAARPRNGQYQNIKAQAGGCGHGHSPRVQAKIESDGHSLMIITLVNPIYNETTYKGL